MTTTVSTAPGGRAQASVTTRTQRGITELSLADMAHVAGGGFFLNEDAKTTAFIPSEKPRVQPMGFILSE